ncbi:MAG: rRNA maturation RNase YbeY [Terrimicrobiaceae bacterium]
MPDIHVASRQRSVRYDHARLALLVKNSLPECMEVAAKLGGPLFGLHRIECAVVGVRPMARVHREFLNLRGPTDVITFPYGEILVCAPVAESRAEEFGHDVTTELALYCIHGLLHLAGHDDAEPGAARRMAGEQARILRAAILALSLPWELQVKAGIPGGNRVQSNPPVDRSSLIHEITPPQNPVRSLCGRRVGSCHRPSRALFRDA